MCSEQEFCLNNKPTPRAVHSVTVCHRPPGGGAGATGVRVPRRKRHGAQNGCLGAHPGLVLDRETSQVVVMARTPNWPTSNWSTP